MKQLFTLVCLFATWLTASAQSNIGFELGNTNGWRFQHGHNTNSQTMTGCCPTVSSNYLVVGPGIEPNVVAIPTVPSGGGNFSLRLGKVNPTGMVTRATYTFNVSPANPILICKYAIVAGETGIATCNSIPFFNITLKESNNVALPGVVHFNAQTSGCSSGDPSYVSSGMYVYKNWTTVSFDLTSYIGTPVSAEFTVGESTDGGQTAYAYIDAEFSEGTFTLDGTTLPVNQTTVPFCESAMSSTLCAPSGYTYNWTGPNFTGQSNQCLVVTETGSYSVTLTQGSYTETKQLDFIAVPVPSLDITGNTTCINSCDGSVSITAVNVLNYNWSLTNGLQTYTASGSTSVFPNLCGDTYTLSISDPTMPVSCSTTTLITVPGSTFSPPSVNPQSQIMNCNSLSAVLDANPSGATIAYEYAWAGPGIAGAVNTQTVTVTQAGTYTLSVTNTLTSCVVTRTAAVLSNTAIPNLAINASNNGNLNCTQCILLSAVITGTPALGAVSYTWFSPSGLAMSTGTSAQACTAGIYSLNVVYSNACTSSATIVVTSGSILSGTVTALTDSTCSYLSDGSIQLSVSPTDSYTYKWRNGIGNLISLNPNIYNLPLGNYYVEISNGTSCSTYSYSILTNTNCSSISGNIYGDANNDCIKTTGEQNLPAIKVMTTPGNYWSMSDAMGNYTIHAPAGTYSLSQVQFPYTSIAANCNALQTVSINTGQQLSNIDFSDTISPAIDGKVNSIVTSGIVPGFNGNYSISVGNNYMINGYNGVLKFVKSPLLNYTSFTPSPVSINGDTAIFMINTISNPTQIITAGFYAPPTLTLGLSMQACAYLQVNATDINLSNNTLCYNRVVTGSYDPNDKSVSPTGTGSEGYISTGDSVLTYLVRFQNTGTGPAVNVVIEDTLSQYLNPLSFEFLRSSHNCELIVLPNNLMSFKFVNIMLPDSNSNEPASHGYIQYRIKQKANNAPGTQIKNTAYIYFDFNEAVVTNTAINTIQLITNIQAININESIVSVYPNPASNVLNFVFSSPQQNRKIILYDALGNIILSQEASANYISLTTNNLPNGIYFYYILANERVIKTDKIVIIK